MHLERTFHDPEIPILDHAARLFASDNHGGDVIDLRSTLIIVPTRHAGRRLRERLAFEAAQRGTAVLTGPIWTPARLFEPTPDPSHPLATDFLAQVIWTVTLKAIRKEILGALVKSPTGQPDWKALAQHLVALRDTLCEEGYTLASFAERVAREHLGHEPERWAELAELEGVYLRTLQNNGFRDDVTEKLRTAQKPPIPEQIQRAVVLFLTDPPPLSIRALEYIAETVPVQICIHANSRDADLFDAWGRPKSEAWAERILPVRPEQIEVCDDPIAMAEIVRQRVAALPADARELCTVGVSDPLHAEVMETTLARDNIPVFNPAGRSGLRFPLFTLVRDLMDLYLTATYPAFLKLVRHPLARGRIQCLADSGDFLTALDDFQNKHLPVTLDDAEAIAKYLSTNGDKDQAAKIVGTIIHEVKKWLSPLESKSGQEPRLSVALPRALQSILQGVSVTDDLKQARDSLFQALDTLEAIEPWIPRLEEQCGWLLDIMAAQYSRRDRGPNAVELLGWLELAWDDSPILVLTDMNDGVVPETVSPNPFLPDNLRRAAGLRGNEARLARDAHVLECLVRSRPRENVLFIVPRRSSDGNPLKPSRLLLQCESKELAQRALQLFRDPSPAPIIIRRVHAWPIAVPLPPQPFPLDSHIQITSLSTYLADPFLFYLVNILKFGEPFEIAYELDPGSFGSLCHEILHRFAKSEFRHSTDAKEIREFLRRETDALFESRFGTNPPASVTLQKELVLRRMEAFAKIQPEWRAKGWEICEAEYSIRLRLNDVSLVGRIDRIDWNPESRCHCIVDYKTGSNVANPLKAHLVKTTGSTNTMWYTRTSDGGYRWINLQMPLYARAWQLSGRGDTPPQMAYFALPDNTQETQALEWTDADFQFNAISEAELCAKRIISRMKAGVFWPPGERVDSPFDRIFFEDIRAVLSAEFVEKMQQRADEYDRRARQVTTS